MYCTARQDAKKSNAAAVLRAAPAQSGMRWGGALFTITGGLRTMTTACTGLERTIVQVGLVTDTM